MDPIILTLRVMLSLGAVLALLWLAQKYARKRLGVTDSARHIKVVARQGIAQKASVVVVDTGGNRFVLGVTEQSVNVLHSGEAPAPDPAEETVASDREQKFAGVLGEATDKKPAMAGSILSPATWKQAGQALKTGRIQ